MPLLGRFMQVDPVGYKQSLNLYTYGLGNPVAHTDPSGAFIGLIIPLLQFVAGEMTFSAFATTLAEFAIDYAIDTAISMGLDAIQPGAGQVFGIIKTVAGLVGSGFGGGPGDVEQGLHSGPMNEASASSSGLSHIGFGDGVGVDTFGYSYSPSPSRESPDPNRAECMYIACDLDDLAYSFIDSSSLSGTAGFILGATGTIGGDGSTSFGVGLAIGAHGKVELGNATSVTILHEVRGEPYGWGLFASISVTTPNFPGGLTMSKFVGFNGSEEILWTLDFPAAGDSAFAGLYYRAEPIILFP